MATVIENDNAECQQFESPDTPSSALRVTLADGGVRELAGLDRFELQRLQFDQEQAFARRILAAPRGSAERADAARKGYDTVTTIFAMVKAMFDNATAAGPLVMGLDPRYERLVLSILARQRRRRMRPALFEIGYGSGSLLAAVAKRGYAVAGIEVSESMRQQALGLVDAAQHTGLLLGDFLSSDLGRYEGRFSLAYWNDVFEHVPPDEILDYLRRIRSLLVPGGSLVTITPNWHARPSDVTGNFCPPRTEARGLHLKEYTLGEVTSLLYEAGFAHVASPLVVTPGRIALAGRGMADAKRRLEPALEWLPFRLAGLLVRGLGLSCTVATAFSPGGSKDASHVGHDPCAGVDVGCASDS